MCARRELDDAPDQLAQDQPVLASRYVAAVGDRQLLDTDPGRRTQKLSDLVLKSCVINEALADAGGVNRSGQRPAC